MSRECQRCRARARLELAIARARRQHFAEQLERVRALKLARGEPVEFPSVPTYRRVR